MPKRLRYLLPVMATIAIGLLSRKLPAVPLWIGDALYATMMYFIFRFILVTKRPVAIAGISLAVCFIIECSQLYQRPWITELRHTLPGRLILGQGFLWSDLAAYVPGTAIGLAFEAMLSRKSISLFERKHERTKK